MIYVSAIDPERRTVTLTTNPLATFLLAPERVLGPFFRRWRWL